MINKDPIHFHLKKYNVSYRLQFRSVSLGKEGLQINACACKTGKPHTSISSILCIYISYMLTHCIDGQIATPARVWPGLADSCAQALRSEQWGRGKQSHAHICTIFFWVTLVSY